MRRQVRELPGVTILDRHEVTSLLTSRDGRQVTGVTIRPLDDVPDGASSGSGIKQQLDADLVVDTSGRGSRASVWLAEAGYGTPTKTEVDPKVAYASRIYRIPDGFSADWQLVMLLVMLLTPACANSGPLLTSTGWPGGSHGGRPGATATPGCSRRGKTCVSRPRPACG